MHARVAISAAGRVEAPRRYPLELQPLVHGSVLCADTVEAPYPHRASRFYRHGWHSFSMARWLDARHPPATVAVEALRIGGDDPVYGLADHHGGSAVGAVEATEDDRVLLLGAVDLGGRVEWSGTALYGAFEGPGGAWYVGYGHDTEVFSEYANVLGERFGVRKRPAPRVWTSWYSFAADIDEDRLLGILDGLDDLPFDCFAIDDGWQRAIGDWRANHRFRSGMDDLAARIRAAGLLPGLWLAPFIARAGARILREHPDWFVRDDTGELVRAGHNWGDDYYGLDLTHPGALAYITDLIRQIVAWGYRFLKLDFLFGGAIPGRRRGELAREAAYRRGIEAIRGAAGDDTYLLGCGAPIVPSLGVFDAIRIGPDVAPYWENTLAHHLNVHTEPSTRDAIATSIHRLWLQPLIGLDPDVAYFRSRHQMLSVAEQRLLQDLARICGCRSTSDPPAWLDPDERAELDRFLRESATIERLGRYRFLVDGREVDFGPVVAPTPSSRV